MAQVKSLTELENYIKNQLMKGLESDVAEAIKDEEVEKVISEVYDKYEPIEYERRFDAGGLADKDNMIVEVEDLGRTVLLGVTNMTTGHKDYSDNDEPIASIIEYGHGSNGYYDYYNIAKDKSFGDPRPFTQATVDELKRNKKHVEALKKFLNDNGMKTK